MDHTAVVREKMTERYLLNELESDVRDQFEEHYFDCPECAQDLCAGSQFVEQAKVVLAEPSEAGLRPRDSWPEPRSAWMVCLASSGIRRARAGSFAGGRRISESGHLSQVAGRTQSAADLAGGFRERRHLRRARDHRASGKGISFVPAHPTGRRFCALPGGPA